MKCSLAPFGLPPRAPLMSLPAAGSLYVPMEQHNHLANSAASPAGGSHHPPKSRPCPAAWKLSAPALGLGAQPQLPLPLFSTLKSDGRRLSCRFPKTKARKERMRASRMPMMQRMYAQRTVQAPSVYLSVLSPHMRFTSLESQPSG